MRVCPQCGLKYSNDQPSCFVDGTALEEAPDPYVGLTLAGRYLVEAPLGEGGMAVVYRARHTLVDRPVAVKIMNKNLASDKGLRERFRREAKNAAALAHPNIIEIFDYGETDDGAPFLVMELLRGETLHDRLQLSGAIPTELAIQIMEQILSALHSAHECGIIHRDLKPDNVFLTEERGELMAKLLDFGVSKNLVDDNTMSLTRTGAVVGTPYYLAPEQARGDRMMDRRVDIWAAGVVMYESLTGMLPFNADNYNALLVKILQQRPVPPSRIRPTLPPALEAVIMTAMAHDADERYATAEEMLEALASAKLSQAQLEQNPTAEHPSIEIDLGEQIGERTMSELHVSQILRPGPEDPTEISDSFVHADIRFKESDESS